MKLWLTPCILLLALMCAVFTPCAAHSSSETVKHIDTAQLLQALCRAPLQTLKDNVAGSKPYLACEFPRAYPGHASDEKCVLDFNHAPARIWRGQFTDNKPQILAIYNADCEPHANNFGGAVLFDAVGTAPKLVRYYPGVVFVDCIVLPADETKRTPLLCYDSYIGQGQYSSRFGLVQLKDNNGWTLTPWLEANDHSDYSTVMNQVCHARDFLAHQICGVTSINSIQQTHDGHVAVRVTFRETFGASTATSRYQKQIFNKEEKELREISAVARSAPLMRQGEYSDRNAEIVFQPNGKITNTALGTEVRLDCSTTAHQQERQLLHKRYAHEIAELKNVLDGDDPRRTGQEDYCIASSDLNQDGSAEIFYDAFHADVLNKCYRSNCPFSIASHDTKTQNWRDLFSGDVPADNEGTRSVRVLPSITNGFYDLLITTNICQIDEQLNTAIATKQLPSLEADATCLRDVVWTYDAAKKIYLPTRSH